MDCRERAIRSVSAILPTNNPYIIRIFRVEKTQREIKSLLIKHNNKT